MDDDTVRYERDGAVATITLDDGKANAFSIPLLRALHVALDRAEDDGAAVVLTGRPGYLSAGFDLGTFAAGGAAIIEMLELGATVASRLLALPRPVVVACPGHALPTGVFLLLAADVRLGADGPYRLGLNETRIGLTLPWFAVALARHRLDPRHVEAAAVQATMYAPRDAVAAGMLDRVVAPDALPAEARAAAAALLELDPRAFAETKLRVRADAIAAVREGTERTVAELSALV